MQTPRIVDISAPRSMHAERRVITPDTAREMLSRNEGNRNIRKDHVRILAGLMKTGRFLVTHQGIALDPDMNVVDGQHRLSAVVMADVPVEMMVFYDVPRETFMGLDQGAKRSHADILRTDRKIIEVVRFAGRFMQRTPSPFDVEEILLGPIGDAVTDLVTFCNARTKVFSASAVKLSCVLSVLCRRARRDYAFSLYRNMAYMNFNDLPTIGHSAVRKFTTGDVHVGAPEFWGQCLTLFDQSKADTSRLVLRKKSNEEIRDEYQTMIRIATEAKP